jgi:hypothetical protein
MESIIDPVNKYMTADGRLVYHEQLFAEGDSAPAAPTTPVSDPASATPVVPTTAPVTPEPAATPSTAPLLSPTVEPAAADTVVDLVTDTTEYDPIEGMAYDKEQMTAFNKSMAEAKLTKPQAQAAVNYYAQMVKNAQQTQAKQIETWTAEAMKTHGTEGIEEANRALANLASPEFNAFLKETGLSNHPSMIAAMRKAYADHKEGSWVDSNSTSNSGVKGSQTNYSKLYPNSGYNK